MIVFRNLLEFDVNFVPTGLESPNATYNDQWLAPVGTNETVELVYEVPAAAGPMAGEPARKLWMYRSMVDMLMDASTGLYGPILISNATTSADEPDVPEGRDIITVSQIVYEYQSHFYEENLAGRTLEDFGFDPNDPGALQETLTHHGINGVLFCKLRDLIVMTAGEQNVRWHVSTIGSELDLHNMHWHGNTFTVRGFRMDIVKMIPGGAYSVNFDPHSPGDWILHCHINDHFVGGMITIYKVLDNQTHVDWVNSQITGVEREYFIQAEMDSWDYGPLGGDGCSGDVTPWTYAQLQYMGNYSDRIGSKMWKALYRQYTDDTYTTRIQRAEEDEYMGLLGPIMRAEVGDYFRVHFRNAQEFPVSVHPHGVWYNKSNEGTPYEDGTCCEDKVDDYVHQGESHTYTWLVPDFSGPGPADLSSKAWMYHSHTDEAADTYAGLVGSLIVYRKGMLVEDRLRAADVDREIVLFFAVMDEMSSLYFDKNLEVLPPQNLSLLLDQSATAAEAEATATTAGGFAESMLKHSINGYNFCNMPVFNLTAGLRSRIHIIALGTEADVHTPNFDFNAFVQEDQSRPAVLTMPGGMDSTDMIVSGAGLALVSCRTVDHISAGMRGLFRVLPSDSAPGAATRGVDDEYYGIMQQVANSSSAVSSDADADDEISVPATMLGKTYYIQAVQEEWEFVPKGWNLCDDVPLNATDETSMYTQKTNYSMGTNVVKALFRQYTDDTFTEEVPYPGHRGLLGPLVYAEVGQTITVVFRNMLDFEVNFAPDGPLIPLHDSEDAISQAVPPGQNYTYTWLVPPSAGPQGRDLNTVAYQYNSQANPETDPYAGLSGVVVIGSTGAFGGSLSTDADPTPVGTDMLVALQFIVGDENASPYVTLNQQRGAIDPQLAADDANYYESCKKSNINGYLYCNGPPINATVGQRLRIITIGGGTEADLHAPGLLGNVQRMNTTHSHAFELMPSVTKTFDVVVDREGMWELWCEIQDHYNEGMRTFFNVTAA